MHVDEKTSIRIASLLADGERIAWESVPHPGPAEELDTFRILEQILAAHRQVREETLPLTPAGEKSTNIVRESLPAGTRWGKLTIQDFLGQGAFGEVYRARDAMLEKDFALKLRRIDRSLGPEDEKLFLQEARRHAKVDHAHVVRIYDADVHDGRMGIQMELLRGSSLDAYVRANGPLSGREAALAGIDLCQALAAVHGAGLVHRDVKPGNVYRDAGGRIVLLDFGSGADRPRGGLHVGSSVGGTPLYMAPEAWRAQAEPASDIYALGVTLFYLVSGRHPLTAKGVEALAGGHPPAPEERLSLREAAPNLPTAFVQVVEKALELDPAQRYVGAGPMELALAAALGMESVPLPPRRPWWRRMEVLMPAGAAAALAVALLLTRPFAVAPAFGVDAQVFRDRAGSVVPLTTGGEVQVGDGLFLDITTSKDMWLYVVAMDAMGEMHCLYPLPGLEAKNPLAGGRVHRLPGRLAGGGMFNWPVRTPGRRETLLLVASPSRLGAYEVELGLLEPVSPLGSGELEELQANKSRGIGGLMEAGDADLEKMIEYLETVARDAAGDPRKVHTQRIDLRGESK